MDSKITAKIIDDRLFVENAENQGGNMDVMSIGKNRFLVTGNNYNTDDCNAVLLECKYYRHTRRYGYYVSYWEHDYKSMWAQTDKSGLTVYPFNTLLDTKKRTVKQILGETEYYSSFGAAISAIKEHITISPDTPE